MLSSTCRWGGVLGIFSDILKNADNEFMAPFSVTPCATEHGGAFKFLAVTGTKVYSRCQFLKCISTKVTAGLRPSLKPRQTSMHEGCPQELFRAQWCIQVSCRYWNRQPILSVSSCYVQCHHLSHSTQSNNMGRSSRAQSLGSTP